MNPYITGYADEKSEVPRVNFAQHHTPGARGRSAGEHRPGDVVWMDRALSTALRERNLDGKLVLSLFGASEWEEVIGSSGPHKARRVDLLRLGATLEECTQSAERIFGTLGIKPHLVVTPVGHQWAEVQVPVSVFQQHVPAMMGMYEEANGRRQNGAPLRG